MKIVIITGSFRSGGAERVSVTLANAYADSNIETYLISMLSDGPLRSQVSNRVNIIDLNLRKVWFGPRKLYKIVNSIAPCVSISTQRHVNIFVSISLWLSSSRYNIFREATTFAPLKSKDFLYQLCFKFLMAITYYLSDEIIANSKKTKFDLISNIPFTNRKTRVVPNPIALPVQSSSEAALHPWLQSSNVKIFIGIGRLVPLKDFETLVYAFHEVQKYYPHARLMIIGEGPEENNLKNLCFNLGIQEKVSFLGFQDDVTIFLKNASAFCLCSKWEGFGNVIVEAGLSRCSIIASECEGGVMEILHDKSYAKFFPVGDVRALAQHMITEIEVPTSSVLLNKIHLEFMHKYSPATIASAYLDNIK